MLSLVNWVVSPGKISANVAPVASLDRTSDSRSDGAGIEFSESVDAYENEPILVGDVVPPRSPDLLVPHLFSQREI